MNRGFTLAETIMAGFVISLVTMALFNIFPTAVMSGKRAEMQLTADSIAEKHLEEMRASDFKTLVIGSDPVIAPVKSSGTEYSGQVEILKEPSSSETALKIVRVTVNWSHGNQNYSTVHEAWITDVNGR
jgi:Tfp pilus assembly protein PilE